MVKYPAMATKKAKKKLNGSTKSILARQDDGTIQVTFSIPFEVVQKEREIQLKSLIDNLEIPGFRKGKAPKDMAMNHVDRQRLYDLTLQKLLPDYYTQAVTEHNLRPVLQPRFELVSVEEEKDWTIRAITCELPEVVLGDYKKTVTSLKSADIWVPGKDKEVKELSKEEKEQKIIQKLLETVDLSLPKLLLDEEINHKLAQLLDQVNKLGLTIEQYLKSTGKNIEQLKQEFAHQSANTLKLVLILNKVAQVEKVQVSDTEVQEIVTASTQTTENTKAQESLSNPEYRALIRAVISRRKALDALVSLA